MEKRIVSFAKGGIGIVLASFAMHSDGKIPDVQVEKIEKWLRHRSKYDERALRALPGKAARSAHIDMRWGFHGPSRSRCCSAMKWRWSARAVYLLLPPQRR